MILKRAVIKKDFALSLGFEHLTFEGGGGGMDDLVWIRIQQQKERVKSSTYEQAKGLINNHTVSAFIWEYQEANLLKTLITIGHFPSAQPFL